MFLFSNIDSTIPLHVHVLPKLQKFHASSHFLWLYSMVCVTPVPKPLRQVFLQHNSLTSGEVTPDEPDAEDTDDDTEARLALVMGGLTFKGL